MDRILRGSGGTVSVSLYNNAGILTDAGDDDPSITVTDSGGTEIAGSPIAGSHDDTGQYSFVVPSDLTVLDTYTCLWTFSDDSTRTTVFETVGGFLFTIADLRSFDPDMADASLFPSANILRIRSAVEDTFEHEKVTNLAFRPRGRRVWLDGDATDRLVLEDIEVTSLVSLTEDGTAVAVSGLKLYPFGMIRRTGGAFSASSPRNIEVLYEFGMLSVPGDIHIAAMRLARHHLATNAVEVNDRATAVITDGGGGYRLSLAGRDGRTGLPEVDACLKQYSAVVPGSFA